MESSVVVSDTRVQATMHVYIVMATNNKIY